MNIEPNNGPRVVPKELKACTKVKAVASLPGANKVAKGLPAACNKTIPLAKINKAPNNMG